MHFSIAPTNLLPLGDQPTRISVRLSQDLLEAIDPSMEPLVEGECPSRMQRKGKAAIDEMGRAVSTALFGTEVPRSKVSFWWPKHVKVSGDTGYCKADHYVGIAFDHQIRAENRNPRVLELTADEKANDIIVFHAVELDAEGRDLFNMMLNEAEDDLELDGLDHRGIYGPRL